MTGTKHVDGVVTLVREATPIGNGEGFGQACNPSSEVVLPGAYSLLGRVGMMDVWRSVL
jgi:hypothetical protein